MSVPGAQFVNRTWGAVDRYRRSDLRLDSE